MRCMCVCVCVAHFLSPKLYVARAIEQIGVSRRILLNHIFDVVRLLRLAKSFARQKVIQLMRERAHGIEARDAV